MAGTVLPVANGLVGIMNEMGYTDDMVLSTTGARQLTYFYATIRDKPELIEAVKKFADFSEDVAATKKRDPTLYEYLSQMVAIESAIPSLCGKVSPNAFVHSFFFGGDGPTPRRLESVVPLRDSCFRYLACKDLDASICQRLPVDPDPETALTSPPYYSRESCLREVALKTKLASLKTSGPADPRAGRSKIEMGGAYYPQEDFVKFRDLLAQMGYPYSFTVTPSDYDEYYHRLASDPGDESKADLLRRIRSLPSAD